MFGDGAGGARDPTSPRSVAIARRRSHVKTGAAGLRSILEQVFARHHVRPAFPDRLSRVVVRVHDHQRRQTAAHVRGAGRDGERLDLLFHGRGDPDGGLTLTGRAPRSLSNAPSFPDRFPNVAEKIPRFRCCRCAMVVFPAYGHPALRGSPSSIPRPRHGDGRGPPDLLVAQNGPPRTTRASPTTSPRWAASPASCRY